MGGPLRQRPAGGARPGRHRRRRGRGVRRSGGGDGGPAPPSALGAWMPSPTSAVMRPHGGTRGDRRRQRPSRAGGRSASRPLPCSAWHRGIWSRCATGLVTGRAVNLAALVQSHDAAARALHAEGRWHTWADVRHRAAALASALGTLGWGSTTGWPSPGPPRSTSWWPISGVLAAGAVAVPLNPNSPAEELRTRARGGGARRAVGRSRGRRRARAVGAPCAPGGTGAGPLRRRRRPALGGALRPGGIRPRGLRAGGPGRRRPGGAVVHLGHGRRPPRRHAHPRQPAGQPPPDAGRPRHPAGRRRGARRPAAVPRVRAQRGGRAGRGDGCVARPRQPLRRRSLAAPGRASSA